MAKPAVILVGADKGGVGKTTVSRALLDYFIAHNIPTRAFDTASRRVAYTEAFAATPHPHAAALFVEAPEAVLRRHQPLRGRLAIAPCLLHDRAQQRGALPHPDLPRF